MKNGFTLVELSIVLVIIGLLIGGILVGQSLIESAKLNKYIKGFEQYEIAISLFQNKYRYLPGDLPIALKPATSTQISDGREDYRYGGRNGHTELERVYAFGDLNSFNMVKETFAYPSTFQAPENATTWPDIFIPKFDNNVGMLVWSTIEWSGGPAVFSASAVEALPQCNIFLTIQGMRDASGSTGLTPMQFVNGITAKALDQKMDDGKPTQGRLIGSSSANNGANRCYSALGAINSSYNPNHEYNLNNPNDAGCYFIYCLDKNRVGK